MSHTSSYKLASTKFSFIVSEKIKLTAMDKHFLLIVMEISIQMLAEDLPCLFVQCMHPELKTRTTIFVRSYRSDGGFAVRNSLQCSLRSRLATSRPH